MIAADKSTTVGSMPDFMAVLVHYCFGIYPTQGRITCVFVIAFFLQALLVLSFSQFSLSAFIARLSNSFLFLLLILLFPDLNHVGNILLNMLVHGSLEIVTNFIRLPFLGVYYTLSYFADTIRITDTFSSLF